MLEINVVARITVLRKIGDVHLLITILGVIVSISIFAFIGEVFGPLLCSYLITLIKIYRNEFVRAVVIVEKTERLGQL